MKLTQNYSQLIDNKTLVSKQKTKHKNQKIKIWCQHQSKMLDFSIEFRD